MTQRRMLLTAAIAAAIAPALVAGALALSIGMFLNALIVAALHVLLLALPIYWLFQRSGRYNLFTASVGGAVIGAVPFALLFYPRTYFNPGGYADFNGVRHYSNGVPTDAAWSSYFNSVAQFAMYGVIGAVVFWFVLRHFRVTHREP